MAGVVERVQLGPVGATRLDAAEPAHPVPALLVHGMWATCVKWEGWQAELARLGFTSYAIDLPGHAPDSPLPPGVHVGDATFAMSVDAIRAAARALGAPVLIAHSLGGLMALKAAEQLELAALVVLAPAAPRGVPFVGSPGLLASQLRFLPQVVAGRAFMPDRRTGDRLLYNRMSSADADRLHARLVPDSGRIGREVLTGIRVDAELIGAPMLVLVGAHDRLAPPSMVGRIARRIGAQLRVYPDHAHEMLSEPGFEPTVRETAEWVERRLSELPSLRPAPASA